jgi:DNA-binding LytR/AlgR family response regulator
MPSTFTSAASISTPLLLRRDYPHNFPKSLEEVPLPIAAAPEAPGTTSADSTLPPSRFLVRLGIDRWRAVDLVDIYFVEAAGDDTRVRLRGRDVLRDIRRLADLEGALAPAGFVRIHRSYLVNPDRILEIRRRDGAEGYEVVMEPPVNRVLPVSGARVDELWGRFR